jgi:hypothetical protein
MRSIKSAKAKSRARGAMVVEYLVVLGALGLVLAFSLVYVSGPALYERFRRDQKALASPMP